MCLHLSRCAPVAAALLVLLSGPAQAQHVQRARPSLASYFGQDAMPEEVAPGEPAPGDMGTEYAGEPAGEYASEAFAGDCYSSDCCTFDECGSGCCGGCCANFGLAAGVEFTYLKPELSGNEAFETIEDFDFEAAPRAWIQWQGQSGWGVRTRWWDFDAETQFAQIGDFEDVVFALSFDDELQLYALDVELTRYFTVVGTDAWISLGARHARLHRHASQHFSIFDLAGGGGDDASVILQNIDRNLDGTGLTMALDMRRPIMQSRFAAICNLRGSVVFGTNEFDLDGRVAEVVPVGAGDLDLNDFDTMSFSADAEDEMWIGELQAGGEWSTPICRAYGGGNAFIRVLFEAQWWNLPGIDVDDGPSFDDELHELLGITAAAGFTR